MVIMLLWYSYVRLSITLNKSNACSVKGIWNAPIPQVQSHYCFSRRASKHSRTSVKIFAMEQAGLRSEIRARLRSERLRGRGKEIEWERDWGIGSEREREIEGSVLIADFQNFGNRTKSNSSANRTELIGSVQFNSIDQFNWSNAQLRCYCPSLWWLCSYDIAMWGWV